MEGIFSTLWPVRPLISDVYDRVGRDGTPEQVALAYKSAVEEKGKELASVFVSFEKNDDLSILRRFVSGDWKSSSSSKRFSEIYGAPGTIERKRWIHNMEGESGGFIGGCRIQNPTDEAETIGKDSVSCTLLRDLADQPLLAKTYAILFPNLINANLPIWKRWKAVFSASFRTLRNALKKVSSKRCPKVVSVFNGASYFAVGMILIGNTPAVGAARGIAPEAAEPGSLQAEDFEKWSTFWFGVVACVGTLVAIIALLKSFNWRRRHSIAGTSAASAPAGAILNRDATQTLDT